MRRLFAVLICLCSLNSPALAAQASLEDVVATLEAGYADLRDLGGRFFPDHNLGRLPQTPEGAW